LIHCKLSIETKSAVPVSSSAICAMSSGLGVMRITFLGTSSGGGPTQSRNCSSLVADVLGDGTLWMVDAGEGTLRQFSFQPQGNWSLRLSNVKKLFVTHMHADHVMGIVTILRNILLPPLDGINLDPALPESRASARIELYGPAGLRSFVRTILNMTHTRTADRYVVHELLTAEDTPTPCEPSEVRHTSENSGLDIYCSQDGCWRDFTSAQGRMGTVAVDAGPIAHRDPCLAYIIRETSLPFRKITILGDTSDPSAILPLVNYPPTSLLIHEATDAFIPKNIDPKAKRGASVVQAKVLSRGHSTPIMAGDFARKIKAERLVLNHIGARFPAPNPRFSNERDTRSSVIREIERQASEAWGSGHQARAAYDFLQISIPVSCPIGHSASS
jgi:ribonuclease Z